MTSWRALLLAALLWPLPAEAGTPSPDAALTAARQTALADHTNAADARARTRADATRAALLAEQQIAAAAALRRLETRTGDDATSLAVITAQEAAAANGLAQSKASLAELLPIMQRLARQPAAIILAMPGPPRSTIRGLIIMQGIAAGIERQAEAVQRQSAAVALLLQRRNVQQAALAAAAAAQQRAEAALTARIAAAKTVEMQDAATNLAAAAAAAAADHKIASLEAMVNQLRATATAAAARISIAGGGGAPVAGAVIERFGDDTVAGPASGVSYRAAPGARVTTPCAGPVLFAARFQSLGMVVIMDCGGGYDFVLSGLTHLDVATGQRLAHGQPVGEMLEYDPQNPTRQPVLYVELRRDGSPVDPTAWLGGGGSG